MTHPTQASTSHLHLRLLNAADITVDSAQTSAPGSPKDEVVDAEGLNGFTLTKDEDMMDGVQEAASGLEGDEPSAADYNPTVDMQEDQLRNDKRHHVEEVSSGTYDETKTTHDVVAPTVTPLPDQPPAKTKDEYDMFADEEETDDMFAEISSTTEKKILLEGRSRAVTIPQAKQLDMSMLDDWDDHEGYYRIILGELLNGRYHVQTNLGKGMFSGVVRATDAHDQKLVAIKIIRNNETM